MKKPPFHSVLFRMEPQAEDQVIPPPNEPQQSELNELEALVGNTDNEEKKEKVKRSMD